MPTPRANPPASRPPAAPGHLGPVDGEAGGYARYGARELGKVLSHYDLGVISRITPFRRGSRRAPKLILNTQTGDFLLKRRARGRDDPYRVAFAHDLQQHLLSRGFPLPRLVPTRSDGHTLLQLKERTYELFEYVHGERYDRSPTAAEQSGVALGELHRLLAGHRSKYDPPRGTFHAIADIKARIEKIPAAVHAASPADDRPTIRALCARLHEAYRTAAAQASDAGFNHWAGGVVHGDWHPGNVLYRHGSVCCVLDFDSARLETRTADVANAALQFSMKLGETARPQEWAADLDIELMRRLVSGYDQAAGHPLGPDERRALPWLMIEAMIIESVIPIGNNGTFGTIDGLDFLKMIDRKVGWILPHVDQLTELLEA